jgi:hypothetical protein
LPLAGDELSILNAFTLQISLINLCHELSMLSTPLEVESLAGLGLIMFRKPIPKTTKSVKEIHT